MLSTINSTILFLWLISAFVDYSEFCYLWQLKEYRTDRFRDFLRSRQGKEYWLQYHLFWRSLIALAMFFWPINETIFVKYVILAVYGFDTLHAVRRKIKKTFRRPRFTKKAVALVSSALFCEGMLLVATHDWAILFLLLILRFPLMSALVSLSLYPTKIIKYICIRKAKKKLASYSDLAVIGITGSYGKSSTKEFLFHLLSEKEVTIKTPRNINTEIGIAQFILRTDFSHCRYFVVEMGAYTKGEIALISDMVKPRFGILTIIGEEHLSLFGSIDNIRDAKYELLRALPAAGFAVTCADNYFCTEFLKDIKASSATFGFDEEKKPTAQITKVSSTEKGIIFSLWITGKEWEFKAPIIGEHNALNITAAMLMARHLGMTMEEISTRVLSLAAEHGVIRIYEYGKTTVIDDTYNSNPAGFRAALGVLNFYPGERKRIVITRGMLELGELSDVKHEEIGGEIAFVADELIIISPDSADALERGAVTKYGIVVKRMFSADALLQYVRDIKESQTVVLCENRLPDIVIEELQSKHI